MNFIQMETSVSKILIVDDHAETRRMTKFFLDDLPFEFEECEDGADALDCYEKTRPDWVLMDWEMRRMDGLTATRRILEKHPQAKILMVTQYNDRELKEAAIKAGAKGFILKENLMALRGQII
ncbi:N/A [soil metagenome]